MTQLAGLIELINSDLSKLDRKKLITLCTIDVHARDVVQRLIDERVESGTAFQWQSQLRYVVNEKSKATQVGGCRARGLEQEGGAPRRSFGCGRPSTASYRHNHQADHGPSSPRHNCCNPRSSPPCHPQVNICDAEIAYNHEYIGNCGALCITPLTDRCYITLTQAQRLMLGGAPAGPAGAAAVGTAAVWTAPWPEQQPGVVGVWQLRGRRAR